MALIWSAICVASVSSSAFRFGRMVSRSSMRAPILPPVISLVMSTPSRSIPSMVAGYEIDASIAVAASWVSVRAWRSSRARPLAVRITTSPVSRVK